MAESGSPPPGAMKTGMKGWVVAVLVIVIAILMFLAGAYVGAPLLGLTGQTPGTTIVVGTNTPFPPMEYRDPTSGELKGFDIDMMNEIGARNSWSIVWRDFQDWDALLAAIQFEGVDIGASSITMSGSTGATRNASFDFSNSYFEADQAVVIKAGSTAVTCSGECTPADLANHTVAVQSITTSYFWILDNLVDPGLTPESMVSDFGDVSSVLQELLNNRVEWVLLDKPAAENIVAANAQLAIAGPIETNELYGFAVADGDPSGLIPKINSALAAMQADGTVQRLLDKNFGT